MMDSATFRKCLTTADQLSCIYNNLRQTPQPPITKELYSTIQHLETSISRLLNHTLTQIDEGQVS